MWICIAYYSHFRVLTWSFFFSVYMYVISFVCVAFSFQLRLDASVRYLACFDVYHTFASRRTNEWTKCKWGGSTKWNLGYFIWIDVLNGLSLCAEKARAHTTERIDTKAKENECCSLFSSAAATATEIAVQQFTFLWFFRFYSSASTLWHSKTSKNYTHFHTVVVIFFSLCSHRCVFYFHLCFLFKVFSFYFCGL